MSSPARMGSQPSSLHRSSPNYTKNNTIDNIPKYDLLHTASPDENKGLESSNSSILKSKKPDPRIILKMPFTLSNHIGSFLDPNEAIRIFQLNKTTDLTLYTHSQVKKSEILTRIKDLCIECLHRTDNESVLKEKKHSIINYVCELFKQLYCTPLRRNLTRPHLQPILKDFLGPKLFADVVTLFKNDPIFNEENLSTRLTSIKLLFNGYVSLDDLQKTHILSKTLAYFPYFANILLNIPNYLSPKIVLDALKDACSNIRYNHESIKIFLTYFRECDVNVMKPEMINESKDHREITKSSLPYEVQRGIDLCKPHTLSSLLFNIEVKCAAGKKALYFILRNLNKKDKSLDSGDLSNIRSRIENLSDFYEMKSYLLENWYCEDEKKAKQIAKPLPLGLEAWKLEDAEILKEKSLRAEKDFKKYDFRKKYFPWTL